MIQRELTQSLEAATSCTMQTGQQGSGSGGRTLCALVMAMGGILALSGCISVEAPDKPIVIELNINMKVETINALTPDAADTIEDNPDMF